MKLLKIIILIVFLLFSSVFSSPHKVTAYFTNSDSRIFLNITLPHFLNSELISVLKTGINLSVSYTVLFKEQGFPFHKVIQRRIYKRILSYNVQSGIFSLTSDKQSFKSADLSTVLQEFYAPTAYFVLDKQYLKNRKKYFCDLKIELESLKLYPPLSLVFYLVDIYNFKTPWIRIPFTGEL